MYRLSCLAILIGLTGSARADEADRSAVSAVGGPVDFERHVQPLLGRLGCNAGSCHGAAGGKGGFRLSLFGQDAALDYDAITAGRVDVESPASSLILQKPALILDHEGGLRLKAGSWEYELLARWIAGGADHLPGSGRLSDLQVAPRESVLASESDDAQLRVIATFADGARLDVTKLAGLRVLDESVASVSEEGRLRSFSSGDTVVVATYRGQPASAFVLVPGKSATETPIASTDDSNFIDSHVDAKLRRLRVEPAPHSSDETFLRRISLATIGQLPTPAEIRAFVIDRSPDKRDRMIDALLSHPLHAAMWATRMCEITGSGDFGDSRAEPPAEHEAMWHAWFRARFAANTPYDEIARGVLTGTTRGDYTAPQFVAARMRAVSDDGPPDAQSYSDQPYLDLFWQRPTVNEEIDVESLTERIAAAFLGVRIECARCHRHPFDRWTQNDHRSFANIFTPVRFGMSPALRASVADALEEQRARVREGKPSMRVPPLREIYISEGLHDLREAATLESLPAKPLGGQAISTTGDRRDELFEWLTSRDNPYFARNFANRVWAEYFGVGLVEPVDGFSAANPASHPALLDALAEDFVQHGYDIQRLERQILRSQAWQRASDISEATRSDRRNYARAYVWVLPAEVVLDAIRGAVGDAGQRAVEVPGRTSGDEAIDAYFEIFNRPERKLTCDCEQIDEPSLRQTMLLLSDPALMDRIKSGHVRRWAASDVSDQDVIDELFLRALSRWPDQRERAAAMEHVASADDRESALADILWSLINTREFVTRH